MRADHRAQIAALAEVVRVVVGELAARKRAARKPTLAALATVDAWIAGEGVDEAALAAAAKRSHEDDVPAAKREPDHARMWAGTAAGNLAWMATQARGWQKATTGIMDAATYALSSLEVAGVPDHDALERVRVAALAKGAPAAEGAAKKGAAKKGAAKQAQAPVARRSTDLKAFLGAKANRVLAKRGPVFEEAQRGSEAKLKALLAKRRYRAHAAVLAFDDRYGGLVFADAPGAEGEDWIVGAYACLTSDAHADPRGPDRSCVPVVYSPNDVIFFLDGDGVAWARDTIGDDGTSRFADDGDALLVRILTA